MKAAFFNVIEIELFQSHRGAPGLAAGVPCSTFVLMQVETLGVARSLDWKVHMRCANGSRRNAINAPVRLPEAA